MKKILAFIATVTVLCSALTCTAFADAYVVSPGHGGDTPPSSPQTGYETGIGARIRSGEATLEELAAYACEKGKAELPGSGRQEYLESVVNSILFS